MNVKKEKIVHLTGSVRRLTNPRDVKSTITVPNLSKLVDTQYSSCLVVTKCSKKIKQFIFKTQSKK